jgi:hypothetical protein
MDADFSVELGADDPSLEFPWEDAETALRHFDIRNNPEQVRFVDEAEQYRELHNFLVALNSKSSIFESAKCDVWTDDELSPAEDIYDGALKFASYIDLVFTGATKQRTNFAQHERLARRIVELLGKAPEMPAQAEFFIRHCCFRDETETQDGFYVTFYLFGYGADEAEARSRWGIALNLVQNVLLQVSAEFGR